MDAMAHDPLCRILQRMNDRYLLDMHELSNTVKQLLLEGVVHARVGDAGGRLFRLLLRRHADGKCAARGQQRLDVKVLAELALVPEREARPLLWKLLQLGFVGLQELSRTADHNPKTTTYLWYVSLPSAYRALEEESVASLARLYARLAAERRDAARLEGAGRGQPPGEWSDEQRREAARARRRVDCLEAALARLSNTALLLRAL